MNPSNLSRQNRPAMAEEKLTIVKSKVIEMVQDLGVKEEAILDIYAELFKDSQ